MCIVFQIEWQNACGEEQFQWLIHRKYNKKKLLGFVVHTVCVTMIIFFYWIRAICRQYRGVGAVVSGGGGRAPQFLADQLTLS